jgi:hypothetical protein
MIAPSAAALDLFALAQHFFDEFVSELRSHGLEVAPTMELRRGTGLLCYYDLADGHIYISLPDLDDPAGRLHLFMISSLMGCETDEETAQFFQIFIPHLIAHEMAHHFRHHRGLFTRDAWHEEQVANELALAMCRQRLTPELMDFSTRVVPAAIRSISERLGSATLAADVYRDPAYALNVAGAVSDDSVACIELIRKLFPVRTESILAASGQLAAGDAERVRARDGLIAAVNEEYHAGPEFVRYVYDHLVWSYIGLVGRESHYIEEFAHDHLGLRPDYLPAVDDGAVVSPAAIRACYAAARALAGRSPAAAGYFEQRYRALLVSAILRAAGTADGGALLDLSRNRGSDGLSWLSAVASAELQALLPARIGDAPQAAPIAADLPADSDRRLWAHASGGSDDRGAAASLARLEMMDRVEALRDLPAAARLELARRAWLHTAPPGALIVRENDGNDDVFFLLSGRAEAVFEREGRQIRTDVAAGQIFGADAFFSRRPRAATVRATEAATCLALKSADLRILAFAHPALLMGMAAAHSH